MGWVKRQMFDLAEYVADAAGEGESTCVVVSEGLLYHKTSEARGRHGTGLDRRLFCYLIVSQKKRKQKKWRMSSFFFFLD